MPPSIRYVSAINILTSYVFIPSDFLMHHITGHILFIHQLVQ